MSLYSPDVLVLMEEGGCLFYIGIIFLLSFSINSLSLTRRTKVECGIKVAYIPFYSCGRKQYIEGMDTNCFHGFLIHPMSLCIEYKKKKKRVHPLRLRN